MGKRLLLIAVISFALMGTASAAVENIKVSGDITAQGILRDLTLGSDSTDQIEEFLFSQVRLRFDADLTEGVSAVIRFINERVWGEEDWYADDTDIDLDLAYIELKEFLYEPLTMIIGRQNLRYGNALIIGDPDTNMKIAKGWGSDFLSNATSPDYFGDLSKRKSFDAIRSIIDYSPWTIDIIQAMML